MDTQGNQAKTVNLSRPSFSWSGMLAASLASALSAGLLVAVILVIVSFFAKEASPQRVFSVIFERAAAGLLLGAFLGTGSYAYSIEPKWLSRTSIKSAAFCGLTGVVFWSVQQFVMRSSTPPDYELLLISVGFAIFMMFLGMGWAKDKVKEEEKKQKPSPPIQTGMEKQPKRETQPKIEKRPKMAPVQESPDAQSRSCPHCGADYQIGDYRSDADEWHCSSCRGLLQKA